jgi:N-acetylglucosamine malate deacetylase 1
VSVLVRLARPVQRIVRRTMGRRAYKWVVRDWFRLHDLPAAAGVLGTMRFSRQIEPIELAGPEARDILVIAPHPDDEVIGPGGTLIRAARSGRKVTVLFLTSGSAADRPSREAEAQACCTRCGFDFRFVGQSERAIERGPSTQAVLAAIEGTKPGAIFVPFLLDDHDDHRRANEILRDALPQTRAEIWAYQVYTTLPGNVVVDITDVAEQKAQAIRTYASQMRRRDWAHFALGLNAFNVRFLAGRNDRAYAESFFVVPGVEYRELCSRYFGTGNAYYEEGYAG